MAFLSPLDKLAAEQRAKRQQGGWRPVPERSTVRPGAARAERMVLPIAGGQVDMPPSELATYQAVIDVARSQLADIQDIGKKADFKRRQLPAILPFVEQYLARGDSYPNSVAVEAMIWLLDVGDIERGLRIGLALSDQGCHVMPKRFDRGLNSFIVRAVADWAAAQLRANQPAAPYLENLIEAINARGWELHPIPLGELYALAAKHAERSEDYGAAVTWANLAEKTNPEGAGVKTLKARCLRAAGLESQAA